MSDELEPCPFCGDPMQAKCFFITHVKRNGCILEAQGFPIERMEVWNRRAARAAPSPVVWVIPGDDQENCNGFIDAMAYEHDEFTRPLYDWPQP